MVHIVSMISSYENFILSYRNTLIFLFSKNHYRASSGNLYKGCAIGDDIISHLLSGAIRDIKHKQNLSYAHASLYIQQ